MPDHDATTRTDRGMPEGEIPQWGPEKRRGLHIDKSISYSDIFFALTMIVTMTRWGGSLEKNAELMSQRITIIEEQIKYEREFRDRQRTEDRQSLQSTMNDLQIQIRTMDGKVDRIGDKVGAAKK